MGGKQGYNLSAKCVPKAEEVMQEMQAAGHAPDEFSFTAMISLYAKAAMCAC
jgi:pentatricopeptide repeat protein